MLGGWELSPFIAYSGKLGSSESGQFQALLEAIFEFIAFYLRTSLQYRMFKSGGTTLDLSLSFQVRYTCITVNNWTRGDSSVADTNIAPSYTIWWGRKKTSKGQKV